MGGLICAADRLGELSEIGEATLDGILGLRKQRLTALGETDWEGAPKELVDHAVQHYQKLRDDLYEQFPEQELPVDDQQASQCR